MKLIVAGGREFTNSKRMIEVLQHLARIGTIPEAPELVCGMARGADLAAYALWKAVNGVIHEFPADWNGPDGKRAGFVRNAEMANFADMLVAFWDGQSPGTKHMIQTMLRLGKPVHIHRYNYDED